MKIVLHKWQWFEPYAILPSDKGKVHWSVSPGADWVGSPHPGYSLSYHYFPLLGKFGCRVSRRKFQTFRKANEWGNKVVSRLS